MEIPAPPKLSGGKSSCKNKIVILCGGRLSEIKGGVKVIEAMVEIVKNLPNVVLLIACEIDEYAHRIKVEAGKLGIEESLVFTGWLDRDEIKCALASSDVVLIPSLYLDAFPRTAIEAMAAGRPVVGTCYGGNSEIVLDGVTGYIVNPLNPEEISEKTLDLLKNPEKAERFGKAGYERIKSEFNLKNKIKEYIAIYETIYVGKE